MVGRGRDIPGPQTRLAPGAPLHFVSISLIQEQMGPIPAGSAFPAPAPCGVSPVRAVKLLGCRGEAPGPGGTPPWACRTPIHYVLALSALGPPLGEPPHLQSPLCFSSPSFSPPSGNAVYTRRPLPHPPQIPPLPQAVSAVSAYPEARRSLPRACRRGCRARGLNGGQLGRSAAEHCPRSQNDGQEHSVGGPRPRGPEEGSQCWVPGGSPHPSEPEPESSRLLRLLWKPGPQAFLPTQPPTAGAGKKGAWGGPGLGLSVVSRAAAGCVPLPPSGPWCPPGAGENPQGPSLWQLAL